MSIRNRILNHVESVTTHGVADTIKTFVVKGRNEAGLIAQRLTILSQDEGLVAHGSRDVLDLEVRVRPRHYPDAINSGQWTSFASEPGPADGRNAIALAIDLPRGEDIDVEFRSGQTTKSVQLKFHRELIFEGEVNTDFGAGAA